MIITFRNIFFITIYIFIGKINPMLTVKAITTKTIQIMQEHTHSFPGSNKATPANLLHQYFHRIHQLNYLPTFSSIYNFHNLNIQQHHMIYHIHTHSYKDSKHVLYHIRLNQSILYIRIDIYPYSNAVYYYKPFYLFYIYTYTFHAILCVLFH